MKTQAQKAAAFRALHARDGAFIIPNPWDAGTAKLLAASGFEALATTSLGASSALGRPDGAGAVSRAELIANCAAISAATELPVSADLENGYAHEPRAAAEIIHLAAQAGVVGGSIEDSSGDERNPVLDFQLSVERVHAAVEVARSVGFPFVLTARAENFFLGRRDLDDTIRRLQAFEKAGADVLYAPGLKDLKTIRTVAASVSKPLNVVIGGLEPGVTLRDLAQAGVKRVSVGGMLCRLALAHVASAAREMKEHGSFGWMAQAMPAAELRRMFS